MALVGCGESKEEKAAKAAADWKVIEAAIRETFKTLNTGARLPRQLTKADLEKVTMLDLGFNQLTSIPNGLEKLTQLKWLNLQDNPDLTKAQIAELQKAFSKCEIDSNPTK